MALLDTLMKRIISAFCLKLLLLFGLSAKADCEAIDFDQESAGLLTVAERRAKLEELRVRELSRDNPCEDSIEGRGSSSNGSGSPASPGSGQNAGGVGHGQSRLPNILAAGESSISISSSGAVMKADLDGMTGVEGSLGQGAEHEALTAVDNVEEMKTQIKAAADAESDPLVRQKLMEKYKELSKQQ